MNKLLFTSLWLLLFFVSANAQIYKKADSLYYDNKDNIYTGTYTEFFPNGNTRIILSLKDGKKDGITYIYFDNKQLKEQQSFESGKPNGEWITFNITGDTSAIAHYLEGKKHGEWKVWDDNHTLRFKMYYSKGNKTGTWEMFDTKGILISQKKF